jgi:hypothetical protein
MRKHWLTVALAAALTTAQRAGAEILYTAGPSFQLPISLLEYPTVDLDADGAPEFWFSSLGWICIGSGFNPPSYCIWSHYLGSQGTGEFLQSGWNPALLAFGQEIGSNAPPQHFWSGLGGFAGLVSQWWLAYGQYVEGELVYSGWYGPLGEAGIGYLGVRFQSTNGLHYGWIRVRLPKPDLHESPSVVDWAYETRPNTPLRAGVIDSSSGAVQFTVEWTHSGETVAPPGSGGTFILRDQLLRGELHLPARVGEVQLRGPAPVHARARAVGDFGSPLLSRRRHTAFFAEVPLTQGELIQLRREALFLSGENGQWIGRLVAMGHDAPGRW